MPRVSKKLLLSCAVIGASIFHTALAKAEEQKSETLQSAPISVPAPQTLKALTREAIEAFYEEASRVQLEKIERTVAFLKKHMHEDSISTMKILSHVPGAQSVSEEMTLNKKQLILKTKEGARSTKVKSLKTKIIAVNLLEEGRKAKVKDTSFGVSLMRVASPYGGVMLMEAEQSMFCDDELALSAEGVIQILKSKCNVELSMEEKK
jgi:hypothetical protein